MRNSSFLVFAKAGMAVGVWGVSFVMTKVVLREVMPATVVWLRFAIAVLILGVVLWVRKGFKTLSISEAGYFAMLGFIGITFHQWLQSNALVVTGAMTAGWIVAITPVFIAFLGWLALKERLGWDRIGGIAVAAVGVLLVVAKGDLNSLLEGHFGNRGDFMVLVSTIIWAIYSVFSRRGLQKHPADRMIFFVMLFGWVFLSFNFFTGPGLEDISHLSLNGWLATLFLGVLCSAMGFIFWYDALQALPASQVGVFLYLQPIITTFFASLILGEPLFWLSVLGSILILAGVLIVNRPAASARRANEQAI